jgi:hypothetical protein
VPKISPQNVLLVLRQIVGIKLNQPQKNLYSGNERGKDQAKRGYSSIIANVL